MVTAVDTPTLRRYYVAAQMATKPLLDDAAVGTELIIGPEAS